MAKITGLGKGLSDLLRDNSFPVINQDLVKFINIHNIEAGDYQPRKNFEAAKLQELADSIENNGLLQPIIVKSIIGGKYKIIAGERRWRASKIAGLTEIPVIIKDLSNEEVLEVALIENIQREELSVIEEAEGFERLIKEFGYTQEKLSQMLGKSRSHVTNLLRLNCLPQTIKDKVNSGQLTMGHARCLIGHEQAEIIAEYIIENDLSVRQTESVVKNWSKRQYTKIPISDQKLRSVNDTAESNNDLHLIAKSLAEKFGLKVTIEDHSIGGKLIFHYSNFEQLDLILSRLD